MPTDYIADSQQRVASRFLLTRQLMQTWKDALWLAIHQPSDENKAAVKQARAAYETEQKRALAQPNYEIQNQ